MQKPRYIVQYWENNNYVKIACKTKQEAKMYSIKYTVRMKRCYHLIIPL